MGRPDADLCLRAPRKLLKMKTFARVDSFPVLLAWGSTAATDKG